MKDHQIPREKVEKSLTVLAKHVSPEEFQRLVASISLDVLLDIRDRLPLKPPLPFVRSLNECGLHTTAFTPPDVCHICAQMLRDKTKSESSHD